MIHHKTPIADLFKRMRARLAAVYTQELERHGVTPETATPAQKKAGFIAVDIAAEKMLKQIDYKNHPEIKNGSH